MRFVCTSVLALVGALGCSSSSTQASAVELGDAGATASDIDAGPADFDCLHDPEWTVVGVSHYKNVLGHTDEMLAVARSADGGTYPVGTIVQLIPGEASVKRAAGFSPDSHDWEFFTLNVSATSTKIKARGGGASVMNFAGESCLTCHSQAASQWDLICGDQNGGNTHGCANLPLTGEQLVTLDTDPRCGSADAGAE
jgi:hypothetical protein